MSFRVLAAVLLTAVSCQDPPAGTTTPDVGPSTSPPPLTKQNPEALWGRTFVYVSGSRNGTPLYLAPKQAGPIYVEFELRPDSRIVRWVSCNASGAEVSVTPRRLQVKPDDYYGLGSSEVGCSEAGHRQDEWLALFFLADPSWVLEGRRLTLTTADTVIEFEEGRPFKAQ